ncbi:unnamed protein product [Leptidea sinapis]|uniref:Uncharacterized protein n=1 Tax=Leptidea sinapis TaxID=189913 RepID=A0A5E4QL33_9NEOP|nr:unnamed protein product [Leptidea sinapis]
MSSGDAALYLMTDEKTCNPNPHAALRSHLVTAIPRGHTVPSPNVTRTRRRRRTKLLSKASGGGKDPSAFVVRQAGAAVPRRRHGRYK